MKTILENDQEMAEIVTVADINLDKVKTKQAYLESDLRWEYLGKN